MSDIDQECPTCSCKSLRGSVYRPECEGCYWFDDNADVIYMLVPNNAE